MILELLFESMFCESSYGFRKGKGVITVMNQLLREGYF